MPASSNRDPGRALPGLTDPVPLSNDPPDMILRPLLAALALAIAGHAAPAADAPPMAAAGVLQHKGRNTCSAVLIAPAVVATAAHCVEGLRKRLGKTGQSLRFRTGAYPGHPATTHEAVEIFTHPLYQALSEEERGRILSDIAVLRLAEPVAPADARPLPIGAAMEAGERLLIASYAGGRGDRARERICPSLAIKSSVAQLSCKVTGGESGAPVLRLTDAGPELAGILVAGGRQGHQPYGFAVEARSRLAQLRAVYGVGSGS